MVCVWQLSRAKFLNYSWRSADISGESPLGAFTQWELSSMPFLADSRDLRSRCRSPSAELTRMDATSVPPQRLSMEAREVWDYCWIESCTRLRLWCFRFPVISELFRFKLRFATLRLTTGNNVWSES